MERQAARIVWKQFGLADAAPPAGRGLKSKAVIYYPRGCVEDFVFFSIKHDLARSCFELWPKIGNEGDKISRKKTGEALAETVFFEILSPSEPILRAKI